LLIKRLPTLAILLTISLAAACAPGVPNANANQLKKYVSEKPAFVLFKPDNWKVEQENLLDSLHVSVTDPAAASWVELYFADNRQSHYDSLKLLAYEIKVLKSRHPDLKVSEVRASKDQSRAAATFAYTRDQVPLEGKLYLQTDPQQIVVRSCMAPAARMATARNLLLDILANFHLGGPRLGPARTASPPEPEPEPVRVQLVTRRAPDGSLSVDLPPDWNFQGQGGMAIAVAPRGGLGFVFTTFQVLPSNYRVQPPPNVIISPYRPPSAFIFNIFAKFNNQQVRVLRAQKDAAAMQEFSLRTRGRCDAEDLLVSWVSPQGASCVGSFKLLNAQPNMMGQWFSIMVGIWGPADDLGRYLPLLGQIGSSFAINDQYAKGYIQQGLAHLRELQRQTRKSIQDLNEQRAQNQGDWEARQARKDNMDSKWDDYRRGNSNWISELEGGKVYKTDPWGTQDMQTGDRVEGSPYDYVHFEGQNPRYPSETMREVSSSELQKYTEGK